MLCGGIALLTGIVCLEIPLRRSQPGHGTIHSG